jgi:maltooligosyltrehalose trehalohydrolase
VTLRVWAPAAGRVELVLAGGRQAMVPDAGGWWRSAGPAPAPSVDCAFAQDGGPALLDPRDQRQPHGVYGPSQRAGSTFEWHDHGWQPAPLRAAVI